MSRRAVLLLSTMIIAMVVAAATTTTASASDEAPGQMTGSSDSLVVLSGRVDVSEGTHVAEVVVFHGPVTVEGMVHGDVVALDGSVSISGLVTGTVVALNGGVNIGPGAHVLGDVVSRETAIVSKDAQVDGSLQHIGGSVRTSLHLLGFVAWWIPVTVSTLLLGLLMLWWLPSAADAIAAASRSNPSASGGWGFVAFVGLPLLALSAAVTLIGLPLGVGLLLAFGLLYSSGYVWGMWVLGRWLVREPGRRLPAFLAGWGILRAIALVPMVSGLFAFVAIVFGFGAVAVAVHRSRPGRLSSPERRAEP